MSTEASGPESFNPDSKEKSVAFLIQIGVLDEGTNWEGVESSAAALRELDKNELVFRKDGLKLMEQIQVFKDLDPEAKRALRFLRRKIRNAIRG